MVNLDGIIRGARKFEKVGPGENVDSLPSKSANFYTLFQEIFYLSLPKGSIRLWYLPFT